MVPRFFPLLAVLLSTHLATVPAAEASAVDDRAAAASMVALGRLPTPSESAATDTARDASVAERVTALRLKLETDKVLARAVAAQAWLDAFGAAPAGNELGDGEGITYAERVRAHVARISADPDLTRVVVDRAYHHVAGRAAHDVEHAYWAKRQPVSFVALVGCIENWARRNAPGLMTTTGEPSICITSDYLLTLRCSPAVAQEVRAVLGRSYDAAAAATGRNILAPAAEGIVSVGGIHLLVAGRQATAMAQP